MDSYLKLRAPVTFLSELRSNLQVSNEPGMRYNIPLMNALVLYVGVQAINHIRNKNLAPNMTTIAHSSHMDIFQNLAVDLDTEGRLRTFHDLTSVHELSISVVSILLFTKLQYQQLMGKNL